MAEDLLRAKNLEKHFPVTKGLVFMKTVGQVRAVDGVDFSISAGETMGLVGESGCGKSTFGRMVTGILPPSAGTIHYNGKDISNAASPEGHAAALKIQMIFQDPFASLNPRMRVRDIIGEAPRIHGLLKGQSQDEYVANILQKVGLDASYSGRYPHQFSGGQRQRIAIARAILVNPSVLILDDATSSVDANTEQLIQQALERLLIGRTSFIIAQRISTLRSADLVIVLEKGAITARGSHQDLIKTSETYAAICNEQISREITDSTT